MPFKIFSADEKPLFRSICKGKYQALENVSYEANELIGLLLEVDPGKRINAE